MWKCNLKNGNMVQRMHYIYLIYVRYRGYIRRLTHLGGGCWQNFLDEVMSMMDIKVEVEVS